MKRLSLTLVVSFILFGNMLSSCDNNEPPTEIKPENQPENGNTGEEKPDDEPGIIQDVSPLTADLYIYDSNGNNLLNPDVTNNLCGGSISVEYEGETYPVQWPAYMTRYYLAEFHGLKFVAGRDIDGFVPNNNHLEFGEFDGMKDWNLSLILRIENRPETYHIEYIYKAWQEKGIFHTETIKKLNDVEIKGAPLVIILE